jgi:hypothetical protein
MLYTFLFIFLLNNRIKKDLLEWGLEKEEGRELAISQTMQRSVFVLRLLVDCCSRNEVGSGVGMARQGLKRSSDMVFANVT